MKTAATTPTLSHLFINTGRVLNHSRSSLPDATITALEPLRRGGRLPDPHARFSVKVSALRDMAVFTLWADPDGLNLPKVFRGATPLPHGPVRLAECVVCGRPEVADEAWKVVTRAVQVQQAKQSSIHLPSRPTCPWLAVMLDHEVELLPTSDLAWMPDWERAFAWMLLS